MKKASYLYIVVFTMFASALIWGCNNENQSTSKVKIPKFSYDINPFIGTGGHGHTFPGATVPFGMVQLSPDTRLTGWDGCSAYHYTDSIVYGFSHTHLSGTGVSDYADILLLPIQGKINRYLEDKPGSFFKHSNEYANAGYYHTFLDDYNIDAELTTSDRCGVHRYTFDKDGEATIFLDLDHRDHEFEYNIADDGKFEVSGYRYSTAWAQDQKIYFVMRFSKDFESIKYIKKEEQKDKELADKPIKAFINFKLDNEKIIEVYVGISSVDIEGARKNLEKEIKGKDFEQVLNEAKSKWEKQFNKIEISTNDKTQKRIFYTSLYHLSIVPNLFSDVDGRFRGLDGKLYQNSNYETYTIFSLWDTYRATHPLYTLIDQHRTADFINTFIAHWEQTNILPVWELAGNETNCMIGIHSIPVISDAIIKDIGGFDKQKAYKAMKGSMEQSKKELDLYRKYSFIPTNMVAESVSKTLEYAFDDWSIAMVAKHLGNNKDYEKYIKRAQYYKNVFDPQTHFMRPRFNGGWYADFDPREVNFSYTEANSWQYSFYVPQDIQGHINLMKGKANFTKKLDTLFTTTSEMTGRHQSDITGMIGQYAHGNEPSHHMAYLYSYAGKPWRTQELIRKILKEMYSDKPDGLSGNEDCGQMSAWQVFSAMGFYPVCPGSVDYIIGSPLFDKVKINLENGKQFTVNVINNSEKNVYIQSTKLNNVEYDKNYITQEDIINGGELTIYMGAKPNKNWATSESSISKSYINDDNFVYTPYIVDAGQTFEDKKVIEIRHNGNCDIYYRINNNPNFKKYNKAITLNNSANIEFYAQNNKGIKSKTVRAEFGKLDKNRKISITHPYSDMYSGGGEKALINKIKGGTNFSDFAWQGYHGTDFEAIVDLGAVKTIKKIEPGFIQAAGAWIWIPLYVDFYTSIDGVNYDKVGTMKSDVPQTKMEATIKNFTLKLKNKKARYVKVFAKNIEKCPEWHLGAGGKAWIFIDEIGIE